MKPELTSEVGLTFMLQIFAAISKPSNIMWAVFIYGQWARYRYFWRKRRVRMLAVSYQNCLSESIIRTNYRNLLLKPIIGTDYRN